MFRNNQITVVYPHNKTTRIYESDEGNVIRLTTIYTLPNFRGVRMTQERADMQDGLVAPADVLDVLPVIDIEAQIVVNEAVVRGFLSAQMGPQMNLASMRSTISDEVEGNRGLSITGLVPNAGQNNVNEVKTLEAIERTPLPRKITTKKILKRLCRPRRRV